MDEEEIIKMDDGVARFFTCFGGNLLTVGGAVQPCPGDPE